MRHNVYIHLYIYIHTCVSVCRAYLYIRVSPVRLCVTVCTCVHWYWLRLSRIRWICCDLSQKSNPTCVLLGIFDWYKRATPPPETSTSTACSMKRWILHNIVCDLGPMTRCPKKCHLREDRTALLEVTANSLIGRSGARSIDDAD